ncbi:MAG: glycosyltransferase [Enhygromyxa sp.]
MLTILDVTDSWGPHSGPKFPGSPAAEDARRYSSEKLAYLQDRADLRYVVVVPDSGTWTERRGRALIEHVEAPERPGSPGERMLVSSRRLRELVQLHRPRVIECGSPTVMPMLIQLAAARLDPRPALLGYWHGDLTREVIAPRLAAIGPRVAAAGERVAAWWSRQGYAGLDAVLVPSRDEARTLFARGVDRLYWTPMGVDAACFAPRDPPARPRGGGASPLVWTDAAASVIAPIYAQLCRRSVQDPALVLAGPDHAANWRFAAARPQVHAPAFDSASERASWLASCDLALLFGGAGACAEAMASALPLVAAAGTRAGELVRESGCGRTLSGQDTRTLAAATLALSRASDRAELGARGRAWISRFDWPSCFERILLCYEDVLDHLRHACRVPVGIHERLQPLALAAQSPCVANQA